MNGIEAFRKQVGRDFRKARESKGMTQHDLFERACVGQNLITNIENGNHSASIESLKILCDAMNTRLDINFTPCFELFDKDTINIMNKDAVIKVRISDIELIPTVKELYESIHISKEDLNTFLLGLITTYSNSYVRLQLWRKILESGVLQSGDELNNKCLKIQFEAVNEESVSVEVMKKLSHTLFELYIEETTRDPILGDETGFSFKSIVSRMCFTENTIYCSFSDSIIDSDLQKIIEKCVNELEVKFNAYCEYIRNHPNGFPFICGVKNDYSDRFSLGEAEHDETFDVEIIEAWGHDEAIQKYIKKNYKDFIRKYYDKDFVSDFAMSIYYGDFFDLVERNETTEEAFVFAEKVSSCIEMKELDGGGFTYLTEEDEFTAMIRNAITKEELIKMTGIDVLTKFVKDSLIGKVFAVLDSATYKLIHF